MENLLKELNNKQQEALLQTEGPVLVTAGAGSGKTRLLTHRIAYLIREKKISPSHILAITFTNKAANEMRERCNNMLEGNVNIWISTFHSMCARILRNDIENLDSFTKNFTIYSDQDSEKVLKTIFSNLNIEKEEIKKSINFHISNIKNNNFTINEYEKLYNYIPIFFQIKKCYLLYQEQLKKSNALDFNDLLNKTYELFIKCPKVLEKYQEKFKYILVDEFQDTNKIQYDILKLLTAKYRNIFVVGDEDQCIYTWRGANYSNISDFQKDFDEVKLYKLEQNYRSTKKIIDLANSLIKNNKQRIEKTLWTENAEGKLPDFRLVYDEKEEAEIVAREIFDLVNNHNYNYSDFAILTRINALTFSFEEKFLTYNIPHRIFGGFKFYERAEIKNIISYLRLFLNPKDDVSFLRIINFPKRGIGPTALDNLHKICEEKNCSLLEAVLQIEKFSLNSSLISKFDFFKKTYVYLLSEYEDLTLSTFVSKVINDFKIKEAYSSGSEEDLDKQLNINTFIFAVNEFQKNNPQATLMDFLESVTLVSDIDTMDNLANVVTIATIHSVKGLEFKYVFIIGLEEKIFPISRAYDNEDDMEEERRLMYVAITRAKENLMLTRCRTRFLFGKREYQTDSRFLKELNFFQLQNNSKFSENLINDVKYDKEQKNKYVHNPFSHKTKYEEYLEKQQKEKSSYEVGQEVLHPKYGKGKVLKIENQFIDVNFEIIGVKTLISEIAPLKIIN